MFSAVSTVQKLINICHLITVKIHYHHNEISFTVVLLIINP